MVIVGTIMLMLLLTSLIAPLCRWPLKRSKKHLFRDIKFEICWKELGSQATFTLL
uniref:ATP synthase F0 subunit 8 n=1 Tax=Romanomermis culicivorax TaxID=13658 RepID=A0A915JAM3_ROMCU